MLLAEKPIDICFAHISRFVAIAGNQDSVWLS